MKVIIPLDEALDILKSHYSLPNAQIVISRRGKKAPEVVQGVTGGIDPLMFVSAIGGMRNIESDGKIPAIKMVRTLLPGAGLAEGKYIVENWGKYVNFVHLHKRLPKIVGSYPLMGME
jgi:ribosomal protein L7/L12